MTDQSAPDAPAPEETAGAAAELPAPGAAEAPEETAGAAAEVPAPDAAADAPAPEVPAAAAEISAAYAVEGIPIHLGAVVEGDEPIPGAPVNLSLAMLNRHGLIAGATGTGKTKTLQVIAEQVARAGTPVFVADMKGDLSGIAVPGDASEKLVARAAARGQQFEARAGTTEFLSLGGQGNGTPIRTTVTDFGPVLLSKVLELNETQESSLGLIFHYADTHGLALLDLKDLRALIQFLTSDEGKSELKGIGGISSATAGVILRSLTQFENSGADVFFGEPAFNTSELLRQAPDGTGIISCLDLPGVAQRPALFSTFMMWLLADLYQDLPEVGDLPQPKLVFFLDEAHLLFKGASKAFTEQVIQTVRLIRSKGVGVFFITQTPKDVPADVLAQLGNRVQHALRAFTPEDAKAIKQTVATFPTTDYDLAAVMTALPTGEAIITVMNESGAPTPVARTAIRAPESSMDPAPPADVERIVASSSIKERYEQVVDRESAYEILTRRAQENAEAAAAGGESAGTARATSSTGGKKRTTRSSAKETGFFEKPAVKSFLRSAGTVLGREITRSLFGTRRR